MDLIVCSTPYQIFTAINMKVSGVISSPCDMLILSYFSDADSIAHNIQSEGLFRKVKVSDTKKYLDKCLNQRYMRYLWNSFYYIRYKSFTKKYGFLQPYDRVYYSFVDPSVVIMSRYYSKVNSDVKYIGYEDGLSDYYNSQNHFMPRWAKWFKINDTVYKKKTVYLYSPSIAPASNGEYEIVKLPSPGKNKRLRRILNRVFQYYPETHIQQKILYFDQLPHARVGAEDEFNMRVAETLSRICADKCLVKIHPRRTNNFYKTEGIDCFPYQSVPFELCCMDMDIDDKIFITNISSACFMPKLIFNKEPFIIFLFNINHDADMDLDVQNFIKRFIASYKTPGKIFLVNSLEEMETVLVRLLEN